MGGGRSILLPSWEEAKVKVGVAIARLEEAEPVELAGGVSGPSSLREPMLLVSSGKLGGSEWLNCGAKK